ncbi:MAG TPA: type II toxin-antitoxin system Phd/YefM family antitoxin [Longimicrobium sp.]
MISLHDIYSLTEFQRNTREHLARLRETGRPSVLTVNGRAELVVQDAASYQAFLDMVERAEAILAVREGLESVERGEGRPAREAIDAIRKRTRSAD